MRAEDVADLQRALAARELDWCVVGGWGVDALLARQSRAHADLDVLLGVADLAAVLGLLEERGFVLDHEWEERRPLSGAPALPLLGAAPTSAFVLRDAAGRVVDVHVTDVDGATPLWATDRALTPADLGASGRIAEVTVRCMTAAMQLQCHTGYAVPPEQLDDVALLEALLAAADP